MRKYRCYFAFMKTTVNKEAVRKAIIKMREDKIAVRAFLKGNSSVEALTSKGIKLVRAI
ncbi:hypothetical protein BSF42_17860 [Flavobacterium sp. ACN6]|nr:hypothetical protein BSF42_17860 [Flavobacterium sp. ACN6]